MSVPVKITAILMAKPGKAHALLRLLEDMAPYCRAERGNLRWDIWQDRSSRDRYVLDELYVDTDAVAAHRDAAHYLYYAAHIPDLADRIAITSDPIAVTAAYA